MASLHHYNPELEPTLRAATGSVWPSRDGRVYSQERTASAIQAVIATPLPQLPNGGTMGLLNFIYRRRESKQTYFVVGYFLIS